MVRAKSRRRQTRAARHATRRWSWAVAGGLSAAFILAFAALSVESVSRADGCDYAQIAREIVEGRGFSSRQAIYLLHLRFLKDHDLVDSPWPNVHRFPLPSLALAAFFLVLGPTLGAVLAYGALFHGATAALMVYWGRRLVGLMPSLGAAALFTFNATTLGTGSTGLAEPVAVFFFTLALALAWWCRRGAAPWWSLLSGAALGVASLGRTNIALALPALVFLATPAPRGSVMSRESARGLLWRSSLLLAGAVLAMSPWLVRNWRLTGSPMFSLHSYFLVPSGADPQGSKWDITRPWVSDFVSPLQYARAHPKPVLEKWTRHAGRMVGHFPRFGGTWAPLLFLAGLVVPAGRGLRPMAWALLMALIVNVAFVSFTDRFVPKYSYHLVPGMLLVAAGVLWRGVGALRAGRLRTAIFVLALAALTRPGDIAQLRQRLERDAARVHPMHMSFISDHTRDDAVIYSDLSFAVTWFTGRHTVRSHFDRNEDGEQVLAAQWIHEELVPIDGVYLVFRRNDTRQAFARTVHDPAFSALFPRRHDFPDGSVFLYRTDHSP